MSSRNADVSNDGHFDVINNFTDSKDVIDLSYFDSNNGVQGHFSSGNEPGAVNYNYYGSNTFFHEQGAAGTPELTFELTGIHTLTADNFRF